MNQHRCLAGCGRPITWRFAICSDCEKIYGNRSKEWPEWLRFLWKDILVERRRIVNQLRYEVLSDINDLDGLDD